MAAASENMPTGALPKESGRVSGATTWTETSGWGVGTPTPPRKRLDSRKHADMRTSLMRRGMSFRRPYGSGNSRRMLRSTEGSTDGSNGSAEVGRHAHFRKLTTTTLHRYLNRWTVIRRQRRRRRSRRRRTSRWSRTIQKCNHWLTIFPGSRHQKRVNPPHPIPITGRLTRSHNSREKHKSQTGKIF